MPINPIDRTSIPSEGMNQTDAAALTGYLKAINPDEPDALTRFHADATHAQRTDMSCDNASVGLLCFLARLIGAQHAIEIGVFTGYSSTALALALPDDGTLTACDINVTYTDIARQRWQAAGVAHKITLHLQPALITLDRLIREGKSGHYDLAFIDADKLPTAHYYEACLQLVRTGGIIAIDNVLLRGRVLQVASSHDSPSIQAIRQFNQNLKTDPRVQVLTLPLGDGLTLLMKR